MADIVKINRLANSKLFRQPLYQKPRVGMSEIGYLGPKVIKKLNTNEVMKKK